MPKQHIVPIQPLQETNKLLLDTTADRDVIKAVTTATNYCLKTVTWHKSDNNWLTEWRTWHLQIQCDWVLKDGWEFVSDDTKMMTRVILTFALHANSKLRYRLTVVHVRNLHVTVTSLVSRKYSEVQTATDVAPIPEKLQTSRSLRSMAYFFLMMNALMMFWARSSRLNRFFFILVLFIIFSYISVIKAATFPVHVNILYHIKTSA